MINETAELREARKLPPAKPCPFCGEAGIDIESCGSNHWCKCSSCDAVGPFESGATPHVAIALWNARKP